MSTQRTLHPEQTRELLFRSADLRADLWRRAALAELENMVGHAVVAALTDEIDEMTITSVQRGEHYTVVTVSGPVGSRATRQLAAHLSGLQHAGAHHLVVDLSRVSRMGLDLLELMRQVEARMLASNGVFELTGLAPHVLNAMEDGPLTEVFAIYRATLEEAGPQATAWAALRCPQGLVEVPEPRTSGRHRAIFDVFAPPRGGRRAVPTTE